MSDEAHQAQRNKGDDSVPYHRAASPFRQVQIGGTLVGTVVLYVVIPKGTTHRWMPVTATSRHFVVETPGAIRLPHRYHHP